MSRARLISSILVCIACACLGQTQPIATDSLSAQYRMARNHWLDAQIKSDWLHPSLRNADAARFVEQFGPEAIGVLVTNARASDEFAISCLTELAIYPQAMEVLADITKGNLIPVEVTTMRPARLRTLLLAGFPGKVIDAKDVELQRVPVLLTWLAAVGDQDTAQLLEVSSKDTRLSGRLRSQLVEAAGYIRRRLLKPAPAQDQEIGEEVLFLQAQFGAKKSASQDDAIFATARLTYSSGIRFSREFLYQRIVAAYPSYVPEPWVERRLAIRIAVQQGDTSLLPALEGIVDTEPYAKDAIQQLIEIGKNR